MADHPKRLPPRPGGVKCAPEDLVRRQSPRWSRRQQPLHRRAVALTAVLISGACVGITAGVYIGGGSPPVWANVLLTIVQAPSICTSEKKLVKETVPQHPSSSSTAVAASPTWSTKTTRA
jgi:hypothetical protein